jgi:methionine-rich copper-binding protein CopC
MLSWYEPMKRALTILLLLGLLLWPPGLALAHVELLSSVPAAGAQLAGSPAEIRLTFSGELHAESNFILFGERFQAVPGVNGRVDPSAPDQLVATGVDLAPGIYTVQWTAGDDDGHQVSGSYDFTVGTAAAGNTAASGGLAAGWVVVGIGVVLVAAGGLYWWRQKSR